MDFYPFRFDEKKLRPLLQRDLYTDPNVVLRELAQNARDAIIRRAKLDRSFKPERDGKIVFEIDRFRGTLDVSDNGVGMSRDGILNTFRYYGRSDKVSDDEVGAFGLGAKSIFAATDSFTIHSKSMETGEVSQVYAKPEGLAFQESPPPRESVGTTVTIATKVRDSGEWKKDDNDWEYPDDDEEENKKERPGLDIATLRKVCRCVRVPIFVRKGDREELVSQQNPWRAKETACLHAEGFDIYFLGRKLGTCKFYMEGFLIFEDQENNQGALEGLESFAVDFTRKDLVDLTMSRDSVIKDAKYRAALKAVYKAIVKHAQEVQLDQKHMKSNEANFVKWLNGCRTVKHKLWEQVPLEVQNAVQVLGGDIMVCSSTNDTLRTTTKKSCILELLESSRPTYFLLGRRKSEIEALSSEKKATIVYSPGQLNRANLTAWLKTMGIRQIRKKRVKSMEEHILCSQYGTARFGNINDLRHNESLKESPVVVFPQDMRLQPLQRTARYLGICAVKICDGEKLERKCVDLRSITSTARIVMRGKTENAGTIAVDSVKVAPPEFFKFAQASKHLPVAFAPDLATACVLIQRGAKFMEVEDMRTVMENGIPEKIQDIFDMRRTGDVSHFRNLAALASSLDMNDPRTQWLLMAASWDYSWADDMAKELASPPPLDSSDNSQSKAET